VTTHFSYRKLPVVIPLSHYTYNSTTLSHKNI